MLHTFQDDFAVAAREPVPPPAPALSGEARPAAPAKEASPSPEKKWKDLPSSVAPKPTFAEAAALCKSPGKHSVPRLNLYEALSVSHS